jgi:hypothetical protein
MRFGALGMIGLAFAAWWPGPARAIQASDSLSATRTTPVLSAWVEAVPGGPEIRAVVAGARCPSVKIDGRLLSMVRRAGPETGFQNVVCSARVSKDSRQVGLAGLALPTKLEKPRRIVILGDTGCRLKGPIIQGCNNPQSWPFAKVAQLAAAQKPDLVIHVGDYYYRETPCPSGREECAGSPYGDTWDTWNTEFFSPARPLLEAAPWIFVRGNHESCSRGGKGWFRLLDADPTPRTCPAQSNPFAVDLGGLIFYVLDSADTEDRSAPPEAVRAFDRQLAVLGSRPADGRGWIVTHRPIWGTVPVPILGLSVPINETEQAAARNHDLAGIQLVLSGHVHDFTSYSFGPDRPAQLIVGTGGDLPQGGEDATPRRSAVTIDGMRADTLSFERFGYFVFDRSGSDWLGAFHDISDRVIARCRLHGRALSCMPSAGS